MSPSCYRQILAIPGGNLLKLVNVSQLFQFRTSEPFIKNLTLLISNAQIAQSLDVSVGKRMEQYAVYHAEHCNCRANSKGQRKNGSEGESGGLNQLPYCVAKILK